jgi:hypothetical protein
MRAISGGWREPKRSRFGRSVRRGRGGGEGARSPQTGGAAPSRPSLCPAFDFAYGRNRAGNDASSVCGFRCESLLAPATTGSLSLQSMSPRVMSDS